MSAGRLVGRGTPLDVVAKNHNATPGQIALAWLLRRSKVIIPIPGIADPKHLEENVASASILLSDKEFELLDVAGKA